MDVLTRVDAMIQERHLLGHPFYTKWAQGTLPLVALQDYARQYYAFESSFPRFLSAIHSRSERADVRAALLENLWDEEHGPDNHAELWLRFGEGIGAPREQVRGAARNPATRALVEVYRRQSQEGPVPAAVAAVYAYEAQVPAVARVKIDGLRRFYGIREGPALAFFETHAHLDVAHAEAERRIILELAEGSEERVLDATGVALDAWWAFLDAVDPR